VTEKWTKHHRRYAANGSIPLGLIAAIHAPSFKMKLKYLAQLANYLVLVPLRQSIKIND
jgi:hypothetical protein